MTAHTRPPGAAQALLAHTSDAVVMAYLRSPGFLAQALLALVWADAASQALLARAPDAVMLAYGRTAALLAPALLAAVLAFSRRHSYSEIVGKLGLSRWLTLAGPLVFAARSSQETRRRSRRVASCVH